MIQISENENLKIIQKILDKYKGDEKKQLQAKSFITTDKLLRNPL